MTGIRTALLRLRSEQAGLTLIELIVVSLLLSLVSTAVGGIIISLVTTQRTVGSVTSDTRTAQTLADAISTPIRNASDFALTAVGASDQMIVARVASSADTISWRCVGFYYAAETGIMYTTTQNTSIATPDESALATWTVIAEGVQLRAGLPVFTADGPNLAVSYDVARADTSPVAIAFTAARLTGVEENSSCF